MSAFTAGTTPDLESAITDREATPTVSPTCSVTTSSTDGFSLATRAHRSGFWTLQGSLTRYFGVPLTDSATPYRRSLDLLKKRGEGTWLQPWWFYW